MLFAGPRRAERRGYDGTICGRIIRDSACFFLWCEEEGCGRHLTRIRQHV